MAMPGVHWVAAYPLPEIGAPNATQTAVPSLLIWWGIKLGNFSSRVAWSFSLPTWRGGNLFFLVSSMQWHSWLNLWWALHLVILVWCLVIRLMNLFAPGQWYCFLLNHTFISRVIGKVSYLTTVHTGLWELLLFRPSCGGIWPWSILHPHRFCQNIRTGCILWWIWLHYLCSLIRVPTHG